MSPSMSIKNYSALKKFLAILLTVCLASLSLPAIGFAENISQSPFDFEGPLLDVPGDKSDAQQDESDYDENQGQESTLETLESSEFDAGMSSSSNEIAPLSITGGYELYDDAVPGTPIGTYNTLQDAVDAAPSSWSSTPPTYTILVLGDDPNLGPVVNIGGGKHITIASDTSTPRVLTQPNNNRHLIFTGNTTEITLENIILRGNDLDSTSITNGGVTLGYNASLSLTGASSIELCSANEGGGVWIEDGNLILSGGTITNNSAENGGGIRARGTTTITLNNGSISENTANGNGGGIYFPSNVNNHIQELTLSNGSISGNIASENGGGIYADSNTDNSFNGDDITLTLAGGSISGNTAEGDGGGVFVRNQTANLVLSGTGVTSNTAGASGGGIYAEGYNSGSTVNNLTLDLSGGSILGNSAVNGGGLRARGAITDITGTSITENTATADGGGVYLPQNTDGSLNSLLLNGGSITLNEATDEGGGIYAEGNGSGADDNTLTLESGSVSENTADEGGGGIFVRNYTTLLTLDGAHITENDAPGKDGGGIRSSGSRVIVQSGKINENTAGYGAGISANEKSIVTMLGGEINDNLTELRGGGVNVDNEDSLFTFSAGEINGNQAADGGGIIAGSQASIVMTGGTISGNTASQGNGGGILAETGSPLEITGGTISDNTTTLGDGGGVYAQGNNSLIMEDVTIENNISDTHNGGGIFVLDNDGAEFTSVVVTENKAPLFDGGGIFIKDSTGVTMTDMSITLNEAPSRDGGGIRGTTAGITITASDVSENTAEYGAGISVNQSSNITVNNTTITGNICDNRGGGLNIDSGTIFTLTDSQITDNEASLGAGGIINGSTFILGDDSGTEVEVSGNIASQSGGGFRVENNTIMTVTNTNIIDNEVTGSLTPGSYHGGGLYLESSALVTISGGSISDNSATLGDGGGIYTEDYSYADPANTSKYSNFTLSDETTVEDNVSVATQHTPINASAFTDFDGDLLTNDQINYYPQACTLVYDPNNGTQSAVSEVNTVNTSVTIKTPSELQFVAPVPEFEFKYWSDNPGGVDAGGIRYEGDGSDSFTITGATTLYAIWEVQIGTLSGYVFKDSNRNDSYDVGEGLPNKTVTLLKKDALGEFVPKSTTTTNSDGHYSFAVTVGQEYKVSFTVVDSEVGRDGFVKKGNSETSGHTNPDGFTDELLIGYATPSEKNPVVNAGYVPALVVTGIDSNSTPWVIVAILAAVSLALLLAPKRRKGKHAA